jgi:membrane protein implicated in regulation of membrane protease activity
MKIMNIAFSAEFLWTLIGILFVFVELVYPHLVLAFFGAGALLTALCTVLGITRSLASQLIVFMVSSLLLLFLLRRYLKKTLTGTLKDRNDSQMFDLEIGKIVSVVGEIDPEKGKGKVKYHGTLWDAEADGYIAAGESARIVGMNNLTLRVEEIKKEK